MLVPIIITVAVLALTTWVGFLIVRYVLPQVPNPVTAFMATRRAARDRIIRNPLDYVRAWVARIAPSRLRIEHRAAAAEATVAQATERETHILTTFKDNKEPKFGFKVFAIAMFCAWLFIVLPGVLVIDFPIVMAASGGNALAAVFGCLLLIVIPAIFSLLIGFIFDRWRNGAINSAVFSGVVIGLIAIVVIIVWYLATLAPLRAEIEYADQIRTAEQQVAMYEEDGDQNAVKFAKQHLTDLEGERKRSEEFNTALVPIAAVAEFATGFFFPIAIPLLLLSNARLTRRKAERVLLTATNRVARQRARQYRRLARTFQRLGLTQLQLQEGLAAVGAENAAGPGGPGAARTIVVQELQTNAPAPQDVVPPSTPTADQTGAPAFAPNAGPGPGSARAEGDARATDPPAAAAPRPPALAGATATPGLAHDNADLMDTSFDLN